ncbi:heterodisulfide reductase-related iron-sulfur binding cluster [Elongatibacter sediminis]|uniref:Heterodisulfide reductase-related iron-sulfur binding cluster n=1 Tax=Elongatibacter sediminis TaxID=3119006 RepID=A0AAW9RAV0_9GAMM
MREGSLEAPTRHALGWEDPAFYDEKGLFDELERVYDICHGCRRCVSLCDAFPTLFDLVDESETFEVDGVARDDYWKVVDQCYLCDLCYQTKCPYVPPHEWNVDFPHLMLRAKAIQFDKGERKISHRLLSNTKIQGKVASLPVVSTAINAAGRNKGLRKLMEKTLDVDVRATLPEFHSKTLRKRDRNRRPADLPAREAGSTSGRVALFTTCYCNVNTPDIGQDLIRIFEHNGIPVRLTSKEECCGMPKLEQGDLKTVDKYRRTNIPELIRLIDEGWDIVAAIPSCVLMFKQELPLMYPDDPDVQKVKANIYDPFEYLAHRHKEGLLNTEFKHGLGKVAWHVPCHQRVQNIGPKTRDILALVPDTEITMIERCSGHDGTYGVRAGTWERSQKIARPVRSRVQKTAAEYLVSDCPMAASQIAEGLELRHGETNPISLLRKAYGLD